MEMFLLGILMLGLGVVATRPVVAFLTFDVWRLVISAISGFVAAHDGKRNHNSIIMLNLGSHAAMDEDYLNPTASR
jgi:hypothetical protein